ncbi:MAG: histone deacetylase [candidate division Zixibacteria bacterium]|nr:histone deacetylase [candidate division Zixibacteria bacterium]
MPTGLIQLIHEEKHQAPAGHPENAERLKKALEYVISSDIGHNLVTVAPGGADSSAIYEVHSQKYLNHLRMAAERGDQYLDEDTYLTTGSFAAAWETALAAVAAVDLIFSNRYKRLLLAARPPGHHAEYDRGMGFCMINNTAVAAEQACLKYGIKRVAVIDWDVHHGNGTQNIFYNRSDVFYISLHRFPFYPGSGKMNERGVSEGQGYTLNIPLPAGANDEVYLAAFDKIVVPAMEDYQPEFIVITAGFDAHRHDPLGGMNLTEYIFGIITQRLLKIANKYADGRVLSILEGGYNPLANALSLYCHLKELQEN